MRDRRDNEDAHTDVCPDYCCCDPPKVGDDILDDDGNISSLPSVTIFKRNQPTPEVIIPEGMQAKVENACGCGRFKRVVLVPTAEPQA